MDTSYEDYARNEIISVGATSQVILNTDNPRRKVLFIRNTSTGGQVITLNFGGTTAVANQGVVLQVLDAYIESDDGTSFQCFNGQITAISSAGGGQLSIMVR
jgi:hypothetical protein